MRPIPPELARGAFTRETAKRLGVTSRMLQGRRFTRVHQDVWRLTAYPMTEAALIDAARLALPPDAHLTGLTRIRRLGLDYGPALPLRFVIARDHHLVLEDVFLHRTKRLPPLDETGVVIEAAFVAYCARARVIDAIKVGDWLLHRHHTSKDAIRSFALSCPWRNGADETVWVLDHLDSRARSSKESELRALLRSVGLPEPEVNGEVDGAVDVREDVTLIGDLVYRPWRTIVEYEGSHHQEDRGQYHRDLDRYALLRAGSWRYVQVTKERLERPRTVVGEVYRTLLAGGYDGPPPRFGLPWELLFRRLSVAVGPKSRHRRR